jgi:two-component system NarL family sensor kinase
MTGAVDVAPAPRGVDGRRVAVWVVSVGLVGCLGVLAFSLDGLVLSPEAVILLALTTALCSYPVRISTNTDFDGSFLPLAMSALLLGPANVVLFVAVGELARWLRFRHRLFAVGLNVVATTIPTLALGAVFRYSADVDTAGDYLLLATAFVVAIGLNLAILAPLLALRDQATVRDAAIPAASFAPSVPISAVLITASVAMYANAGLAAFAFIAAFVVVIVYVLHLLDQARASAAEAERFAENSRLLAVEAIDAEKRVRSSVASELHDEVIQALLVARQDLSEASRDQSQRLGSTLRAVDDSVDRLRRTVSELHPAVLRAVGLKASVEGYAAEQAERAGFRVSVHVADEACGLADDAIYALTRELVTNSARHSSAMRVRVDVQVLGPTILVQVSDDGVGIDPDASATAITDGHIGLASWRDRIVGLGGILDVYPSTAGGTIARATFPAASSYRASARTRRAAVGGPQGPTLAQ